MQKLFDVVIERCPQEGDERFELINRLVRVFRVRRELITTIVETAPRVVKSGVDASTAERFAKAIYAAGAPVKIEHHTPTPPRPAQAPAAAAPMAAAPVAAAPVAPAAAAPAAAAPAAAASAATMASDVGGEPGWLYFRALDVIRWPSACAGCYDPAPTESLVFGTEAVTQAILLKAQTAAVGGKAGDAVDVVSTLAGGAAGGGLLFKGIAAVVGSAVASAAHPGNGERGSYQLPICKACLSKVGFLDKGNIAGANEEVETSLLDRRFRPPVVEVKFREARYAAELLRLNPGLVCTSHGAAKDVVPITRRGPEGDRDDYRERPEMGGRGLPLAARLRSHLQTFWPMPGFFVAPELPERELLKARRRCGVPLAVDVLGFIDLSPAKPFEAAMLFTEAGIHYRLEERDGRPQRLSYEELQKALVVPAPERRLCVGTRHVLAVGKGGVALNELVDLLRTTQAGLSPESAGSVRLPTELAPPLHAQTIAGALQRHRRHDSLYLAPMIPEPYRQNGLRAAAVPADETVVALLDTLMAGAARNALVIGTRGLYFGNGPKADTPRGDLPYGVFARSSLSRGRTFVDFDEGLRLDLSVAALPAKKTLVLLQDLQAAVRAVL